MGKYIDFSVRYDPDVDTKEQLSERIMYSVIVKRLLSHKPAVIFLSGDSGEGKTYAAIALQILLCKIQGIDIMQFLEVMNIFTPLEYGKKLDKILYDKALKKVNISCMHEAREVVKAKQWQSLLSQTVSDVNAMSRAIKRICFIIISQFIRDITTDVRYSLNYYVKVSRPLDSRSRLEWWVLWKDDSDLEKPKLRKRKLRGYIVDKKGRHRLFTPKYIEVKKPPKEICDIVNKLDFDAKAAIIRRKLDKLIKDLSLEFEIENKKVEVMADFYVKNPEQLTLIGKRSRGRWVLKPEVKVMHDLTDQEVKDFGRLLNERIKDK